MSTTTVARIRIFIFPTSSHLRHILRLAHERPLLRVQAFGNWGGNFKFNRQTDNFLHFLVFNYGYQHKIKSSLNF